MLKRKILITATLLFISPVFIQVNRPTPVYAQRVQDIQGWNNTRWGMSYEQIKALYPIGSLQPNQYATDFQSSASIEGFPLGGSYYRVEFHFNNNMLESVILRWDQIGRSPYPELSSSLSGRYGIPNEGSPYSWQRIWNLPTTKITMTIPVAICPSIYECGINLAYRRQPITRGI